MTRAPASFESASAHRIAGEDPGDLLPFVVELWSEDKGRVETILARVHSASLAYAVFSASRADFPTRFLTLRQGGKFIRDTSETASQSS
jgi:hypothetical protein